MDVWAGYADEAQTKLWEEETIVNVYSTTKVMTALCVLMLVDAIRREFSSPTEKPVWILVILLGGPLGAIIYWALVVRKAKS